MWQNSFCAVFTVNYYFSIHVLCKLGSFTHCYWPITLNRYQAVNLHIKDVVDHSLNDWEEHENQHTLKALWRVDSSVLHWNLVNSLFRFLKQCLKNKAEHKSSQVSRYSWFNNYLQAPSGIYTQVHVKMSFTCSSRFC